MSAAKDPYVQVYYRIADDPRFERVYNNDAALATWLRLLILADAMWPANAPIPRRCKRSALQILTNAGLIDLTTGETFRVHGMDAERSKKSSHAQLAARERWSGNAPSNAVSNAPSTPQTMPLNSAQNNSTQRNGAKPPEETPYVLLTDEEKAAYRQREQDELNAKTKARLGVQ